MSDKVFVTFTMPYDMAELFSPDAKLGDKIEIRATLRVHKITERIGGRDSIEIGFENVELLEGRA